MTENSASLHNAFYSYVFISRKKQEISVVCVFEGVVIVVCKSCTLLHSRSLTYFFCCLIVFFIYHGSCFYSSSSRCRLGEEE